jgi:hypothetical protein
MLKRLSDWPSRLQSYLNTRRDTRFAYGDHDCCLFGADCIAAMTDQDIAEWFRGKYHSRKEALALIGERTGKETVAAIAEYSATQWGMQSVPISMARRGDMVLVGKGSKSVLGIVSLNGADIMCLHKNGIVRVAIEHATKAWRV